MAIKEKDRITTSITFYTNLGWVSTSRLCQLTRKEVGKKGWQFGNEGAWSTSLGLEFGPRSYLGGIWDHGYSKHPKFLLPRIFHKRALETLGT